MSSYDGKSWNDKSKTEKVLDVIEVVAGFAEGFLKGFSKGYNSGKKY